MYIYIIHYVVTTIVVIPITSPFCLLIHYFQLCIFYRIPQKTYIYIYLYIYMYILIHKEKHINKIHFPSSISCYISNERSTSPCLCLQRFFTCFSLGWCEGDLLSLFKYSVCSCLNFSASHSHHSGIYIFI